MPTNPQRTNVVIDEALMAQAMQATGLRTKKAVIEAALQTLVRLKAQERIRNLRGQLHWEGDLDTLRAGRQEDTGGPDPRAGDRPDVDRPDVDRPDVDR